MHVPRASGLEVEQQELKEATSSQLKSLTASSDQTYCTESSLFDPAEASVFRYCLGHEKKLQSELACLDSAIPADVWILATDGSDGNAALGLIRSLRHEYPAWTLRLIIFPFNCTWDACIQRLVALPSAMKEERDIILDAHGHALVPRMIPLPPSHHNPADHASNTLATSLVTGKHSIEICAHSDETVLTSIYGFSHLIGGLGGERRPMIGLVSGIDPSASGCCYIDPIALSSIPPALEKNASLVVKAVPGLVIAILAQGLHTLNLTERVSSLRVLVTHSKTTTATSIVRIYTSQNISVVSVPEDTSLLGLSSLCHQQFNLILSGYQDLEYVQVLQSLLVPGRGKIHLWASSTQGPAALLQEDPWAVHDALKAAIVFLEEHIEEYKCDVCAINNSMTKHLVPSSAYACALANQPTSFTCDAGKTYLILGGIGSLGAYIALLLYQVRRSSWKRYTTCLFDCVHSGALDILP